MVRLIFNDAIDADYLIIGMKIENGMNIWEWVKTKQRNGLKVKCRRLDRVRLADRPSIGRRKRAIWSVSSATSLKYTLCIDRYMD